MPKTEGQVKALSEEELKEMNTGSVVNMSDAQIQALADKSGDTPDHIRKMLKLNETGLDTTKIPVTDPGRESDDDTLLAGKYKSEEDLDKGFQSLVDKYGKEKAYKMLEKGMSDSSQNADTKDNKIDDKSTQTKDVLSVDDDTGGDTGGDDKINFEKFYTEYAENEGKLSEDSYKELNEMGFDEDTVNAFMTGQEAKSELYTLKVYEMAGSKEQWNAMIDWSTTALSSGEKTKFNDAIKSNDLGSAKVVIDALKHRYTQSQGTFKRQALESSDGDVFTAGVVGYESVEQMKRDMNDPKYKAGDQAFHKQVMAKIAASAIM